MGGHVHALGLSAVCLSLVGRVLVGVALSRTVIHGMIHLRPCNPSAPIAPFKRRNKRTNECKEPAFRGKEGFVMQNEPKDRRTQTSTMPQDDTLQDGGPSLAEGDGNSGQDSAVQRLRVSLLNCVKTTDTEEQVRNTLQ